MPSFINPHASGFYPKVGDLVIGATGRKYQQDIIGIVLPSKKNPSRPAIFSRYGYVGLYVRNLDTGKQQCVNNIRPAPALK